MKEVKWSPRKGAYIEALRYLHGRMKGEIRSFKTPWYKFNDAGVDGIEWRSTVVIGGRPGSFKTTIKDLIFNKANHFNPQDVFKILDFQFEMVGQVTAIREFSAATGMSYKDLCSAKQPLSVDMLKNCGTYVTNKIQEGVVQIDTVETACSVLEFRDIVEEYMELHKVDGKYTNTVIGIDHTRLFVKAPFEYSEEEMISNLGKMLTFLKRKYPIIFFVLSQLNRDIERPERNENGKASNYPTSSDIFGSDGLYQHADIVAILNRPALKNIEYYGTSRYVIDHDGVLPIHFIKCRNGDTRLSFFHADGEKMDIYEVEPPPRAALRLNGTAKQKVDSFNKDKPTESNLFNQ